MDYTQKYIKYKSKYIALKKELEQRGGLFGGWRTYFFCESDYKLMLLALKENIPSDLIKNNKGKGRGLVVRSFDKDSDYYLGKNVDEWKKLTKQQQDDKIVSENLRMIEKWIKSKEILKIFPSAKNLCKIKDSKNRCLETLKFRSIVVNNNTFGKNELITTIDYFDPNGPYYNAIFELYKKYNMGWTLDTPTKLAGIYVTKNGEYAMWDEDKINSEEKKNQDDKTGKLVKELAELNEKKKKYEEKIKDFPNQLAKEEGELKKRKNELEDYNKKHPIGSYERTQISINTNKVRETETYKGYKKREEAVKETKSNIKNINDNHPINIKKLEEVKKEITELENKSLKV
jgi:hypothetical protein